MRKQKLIRRGSILGDWIGRRFDFPWLVLSWKQGQKIGNLVLTDQVLRVLGHLLPKLWFGFLDLLLQSEDQSHICHRVEARGSYVVGPLSVYLRFLGRINGMMSMWSWWILVAKKNIRVKYFKISLRPNYAIVSLFSFTKSPLWEELVVIREHKLTCQTVPKCRA